MTQWKPQYVPAAEQSGVPDLNPPPMETEGVRGSDPHIYMARRRSHPTQPGWIIPRDSTANQQAKYIKAGWEPLEQYGSFVYGQFGNDAVKDVNGVHFDSSKENYKVFFQRGGAPAMPVDQVIAYGWHLRPPYKGVVFPQLEGLNIPSFQCEECDHAPFVATTHLKIHLESTHNYTRMELTAYAKDIGISWERRVEEHEKPNLEKAEPFSSLGEITGPELNEEKPVSEILSCDECDYQTNADHSRPSQALAMHQRKHASPAPELVVAGVSEETTHGLDANP
jgi:hypothetical protein|tara:strand:- start:6551 stop:7393 length:843 start_codon:yes stop_codon:yes gene_type:complete